MKIRVFVLTILIVVSVTLAAPAHAQTAPGRLEVGAHASLLRLADFGATNAGIGGRLSFNLSSWLAVEGEASFFPHDKVTLPSSSLTPELRVTYDRRRSDLFFGAKMGLRRDRFGVFGKVRPGLTRLAHKGVGCVGNDCALILLALPQYRTAPALDLGGVLEMYPSARTVARIEFGDTIISNRSVAAPCPQTTCGTGHNLSSRFGFGVRF